MHLPTVIIVGHGSRDASANVEFEQLVERYRARRTDLDVRHGYIELAQPPLADALQAVDDAAERVMLVPLFLFAAGHVKNDIPLALGAARAAKPNVTFTVTRALGVEPKLVELILLRAGEVMPLSDSEALRTTVIVVGRGSSDPDANGDFCKVTQLLAEARPWQRVLPSFLAVAEPRLEQAFELAASSRPDRLLVLPYLLFAGRLIARIGERVEAFRARYPWIQTVVAPHLGADDRLLELIDGRVSETTVGRAPLPCDTSQ